VDFGCGPATGFIAVRLSGADGSCIWSRAIDDTVVLNGAAFDGSGGLLVLGATTAGSSSLACPPFDVDLAGSDGWMARLSLADGTCTSANALANNPGALMALDAQGAMYAVWSWPQQTWATLHKLDPSGTELWSKEIHPGTEPMMQCPVSSCPCNPAPCTVNPTSVAITPDQKVWMTANANCGAVIGSSTVGSSNLRGLIVAFTPDGDLLGGRAFDVDPGQLVSDPAGQLLLTGYEYGPGAIGGVELPSAYDEYALSPFLAKLDPGASLAPVWVRPGFSVDALATDGCRILVASSLDVTSNGGTIAFESCGQIAAANGDLAFARLGP
jgi:hypothetical protein